MSNSFKIIRAQPPLVMLTNSYAASYTVSRVIVPYRMKKFSQSRTGSSAMVRQSLKSESEQGSVSRHLYSTVKAGLTW